MEEKGKIIFKIKNDLKGNPGRVYSTKRGIHARN